jgi:hypothetical protein
VQHRQNLRTIRPAQHEFCQNSLCGISTAYFDTPRGAPTLPLTVDVCGH